MGVCVRFLFVALSLVALGSVMMAFVGNHRLGFVLKPQTMACFSFFHRLSLWVPRRQDQVPRGQKQVKQSGRRSAFCLVKRVIRDI